MSDDDLRSLRRRFLSDQGDVEARDRLMAAERRAGVSASQAEVDRFRRELSEAALANMIAPSRGDFPFMSERLLRHVAERRMRDSLRWCWFRVTHVQGGTLMPLALVVRYDQGKRMSFALGRAQTGWANVLAPQLVWTELGPNWVPGAHEHGAFFGQSATAHEYRSSWDDGDVDQETGLCRMCGENPGNPADRRILTERPEFERRLTEFASGGENHDRVPAVGRIVRTTTAIVRTMLELPVSAP